MICRVHSALNERTVILLRSDLASREIWRDRLVDKSIDGRSISSRRKLARANNVSSYDQLTCGKIRATLRLNRATISFNYTLGAMQSVVLFFPNHDGAERLARSSIRLLPNLATTDVRNFAFLIKLLELSVFVRLEEVTCISMRAHAWRYVSEKSRVLRREARR